MWLQDRTGIAMFRRVTKVSLSGPEYGGDLLPQLARLSDLRELELANTSITARELQTWQARNQRVLVSRR